MEGKRHRSNKLANPGILDGATGFARTVSMPTESKITSVERRILNEGMVAGTTDDR